MYNTYSMHEAYIFDVDGVITDPVEKKVTKLELIEILAIKIQQNVPVALISGRGLIWLRKQVVSLLETYLDDHPEMDKKKLDNLYVSGEFGGVYYIHTDGVGKELINQDFFIPQKLRDTLNKTAEQFEDTGFVEHDKQTQFTIEAHSGKDFFKDNGEEIVAVLRKDIAAYPQLQAVFDRIGMNVKNENANKRHAIKQYLQWLEEKGFTPEKFYVFGDSPSDLEMGEELNAQGKQFTFIFVGNKQDIANKRLDFPVTIMKEHCDAGTLEFLQAQP